MDTNKNEFFVETHTIIFPFFIILISTLLALTLFKKFTKIDKKIIPSISILCFFIGISKIGYFYYDHFYKQNISINYESVKEAFQSSPQIIYNMQPLVFGDAFSLGEDLVETYNFSKHVAHNKIAQGIVFNGAKNSPDKIIIIIGESSLRTHYQPYGYAINTTPNIEDIFSTPNSCSVNDVHASAPETRDAIRMSLTFSTPQDNSPYFANKNIIEMAKSAGYKTYWISSTDEKGFYSSYVGMISSYSDFFSDRITKNGLNTSIDDISLIDGFKSIFNKKEKQMIFVHLNGSHMPYTKRYDSIDAHAITGAPSAILDYDRSLHHTDRLVASIYDFLHINSSNYVLFYSPDHGEIIGLGHGLTFGGTDQYEIPMMMKYSHGDFCHEVEKYRNKDGYINSFAEHYIFSEFMGYSVTSQVIDNYMKESPFVYHSDDNVYHYPFLPQK